MHSILFGMKRAFQSSLGLSRRLMRPFGLTPARFDLLFALHPGSYMKQSELRKILGVSRATTSRMLRSLELLDLVTREVAYRNKRERIVSLTKKGLTIIQRAVRELMDRGPADLIAEGCSSWSREPDLIFSNMCRFDSHLRWVRDTFGDTARLAFYPWHPDD